MSGIRTYGPRILRLNLSNRYLVLQRRAESTGSVLATASTPSQPPPKHGFFRRNQRAIIWSSLGLTLGAVAGQFVVHFVAPPALPNAGTREDGVLMADLNQCIDNEFKVKALRGKCLGMAKQLKGEDSGWAEVISLSLDLGEKTSISEGLVARLQGAKGFGVERLFWNRGENKLVAVIWFGGSLSGWPGVAHGGAIATAMAEKLSLAAALADKSNTDTLAAATPQRLPGTGSHAKMPGPTTIPDEPSQLSMSYVNPTMANHFYVIRVAPALGEKEADKIVRSEPVGGTEWEATLETLDAQVCVKARARFAPSTQIKRTGDQISSGARRSYADFKEWMWPSRQNQSQIG